MGKSLMRGNAGKILMRGNAEKFRWGKCKTNVDFQGYAPSRQISVKRQQPVKVSFHFNSRSHVGVLKIRKYSGPRFDNMIAIIFIVKT